MPQVFISYRRDDTAGVVGRLYDRLSARFGQRNVFLDVDAVPRGVDFREQMLQAVRVSDVFLLIIGKDWLGSSPDGPRIMAPSDYVRLELEAAFDAEVPVIPVLVDGVAMPDASQLPESLGRLVYLNAAVLRIDQDFQTHTARLIDDIEKSARSGRKTPSPVKPGRHWPAAAVAIVIVAALGAPWLLPKWFNPPKTNEGGQQASALQTAANPDEPGASEIAPTADGSGALPAVPQDAKGSGGDERPGDASERHEKQATPVEIARFDPQRDLSAYGATEVREAMALLAERIAKALSGSHTYQVRIGAFQGPPHLAASGGPHLQKLLQDELVRRAINVNARADWGVSGEYSIVNQQAGGEQLLAVEIRARLVNAFGKPPTEVDWGSDEGSLQVRDNALHVLVLNERDVCHLAGASVALPPKGTPQERSQRLLEALSDPIISIENDHLRAGHGSPYAVEFRANGQPLPPDVNDGMAFLPLADVEQFQIVLHNEADYHAAALVTIDGLNVFEFSEWKVVGGRLLRHEFIVPPRSNATLAGWPITHSASWAFSARSFPKPLAPFFEKGPEFGTVSVTFSAAWPLDSLPPPDEPPVAKSVATAHGAAISQNFATVEMKFGIVRSAVSARFEKP